MPVEAPFLPLSEPLFSPSCAPTYQQFPGNNRQAALTWWPGTVLAGRVDDQPWACWDLMPTFVEMSGAKPPAGYETDGISLVNYLQGGQAPAQGYFYWELHAGKRPVQAARFGHWKTVRNGIDKPVEIYDHSTDAAESRDLANARPDPVKKALGILTQAHRADPNCPLTGPTPGAPRRRPESMGHQAPAGRTAIRA